MKCLLLQRIAVSLALAFLGAQLTQAQTTLVATGSVWKYLDNGSDQGTAWRGPLFDDTSWTNGPAQLGYGDNDQATVVNGGPSTNRFITTYFRHTFHVSDASLFTNLLVRLLRDDGGVVYLNGVEVFKSNLTNDPVTAQSLAATNVSAGDESTNFYARLVSSAPLISGDNVLAVEIHQVSITSSDISFDLELLGNVAPAPPSVAITSPASGATLVTARVPINVTAADSDGTVALVEFFVDGAKAGEDAAAPYSLTWSNVPQGSYTLAAVATDNSGLRATSAPVAITIGATLIPGGANWKFLDDGSDAGAAWRDLVFDDTGWSNGVAQLGYGDGDELTVVNGGPTTNRFITTYFRHVFNVIDPAPFSNVVLRLLRDDGGVVWLNGVEVFRNNMPTGAVDYLTEAVAAIDDNNFHATNVNPGLLVAGDNLVAVELHQAGPTSSDISFDLELIPNIPPMPPVIAITAPTNNATFIGPTNVTINANATDFDDPIALVEFFDGADKIGQDATEAYSFVASNLSLGAHLLRAVATDNSGLSTTSAPVNVTIVGAPVFTTLVATGSVWKYLDNGSDQGVAWRAAGFDDSGWASGAAELGFGDGPLTLLNSGPAGNFFITYYFRRAFDVTGATSFTNFAFRVLRDDGAVVYLNGAEVFRMNMPLTPVTYTTPATSPVGNTNEAFYFPTNLSAAALINGRNVLAVEVHQSGPTSSDLSFDLGVIGIAPPLFGPPPLSIAWSGADVVISWAGSGFILQEAGAVTGAWTDLVPAASPYTITAPTGTKFYRLRSP